jgi:hypothetical protein
LRRRVLSKGTRGNAVQTRTYPGLGPNGTIDFWTPSDFSFVERNVQRTHPSKIMCKCQQLQNKFPSGAVHVVCALLAYARGVDGQVHVCMGWVGRIGRHLLTEPMSTCTTQTKVPHQLQPRCWVETEAGETNDDCPRSTVHGGDVMYQPPATDHMASYDWSMGKKMYPFIAHAQDCLQVAHPCPSTTHSAPTKHKAQQVRDWALVQLLSYS